MTEFEHGVYILRNVFDEYGNYAAFVWLAGWLRLGLINKYQYEDYADAIRGFENGRNQWNAATN